MLSDRMEDDGWSVREVELAENMQEEVEMAKRMVQESVAMLGFTPQEHWNIDH